MSTGMMIGQGIEGDWLGAVNVKRASAKLVLQREAKLAKLGFSKKSIARALTHLELITINLSFYLSFLDLIDDCQQS